MLNQLAIGDYKNFTKVHTVSFTCVGLLNSDRVAATDELHDISA